jgi:hypothetical protein
MDQIPVDGNSHVVHDFDPNTGTPFVRVVNNPKEHEKVVIPPFPNPVQHNSWKTNLSMALVEAGGRYDNLEMPWIQEAWQETTTYESLAVCEPRFRGLDLKLSHALRLSIFKSGEANRLLIDDLSVKLQDAVANGRMVTGRQMTWMILDFHRTTDSLNNVYSVTHLAQHNCTGDDGLQRFIQHWDAILRNIKDDLKEETKRDLLYEKLAKVKCLAEDLAHYRRLPKGHDDRTYKWLRESVHRALSRTQEDKNVKDKLMKGGYLNTVLGEKSPALASPETEKGGKGKKDNKGKGKGAGKAKAASGGGAADKVKYSNGVAYTNAKGELLYHLICSFFNQPSGCKKGKECNKAHHTVKQADVHLIPGPKPKGEGKGKKDAGKKGGGKSAKPSKKEAAPEVKHCFNFTKPVGCDKGDDCPYAHITLETLNNLKAKAKAKAKAKS